MTSWVRGGRYRQGNTIQVQALAIGTSALKAELRAFIRALEMSLGKNVNIYTDAKYVFMAVYAHGAI